MSTRGVPSVFLMCCGCVITEEVTRVKSRLAQEISQLKQENVLLQRAASPGMPDPCMMKQLEEAVRLEVQERKRAPALVRKADL